MALIRFNFLSHALGRQVDVHAIIPKGQKISRDDALEIAKKACIKGPRIGPEA